MPKTKLDQVLEDVRALSAEEQQQLRELLDTSPPLGPGCEREDELEQELLAAGLLSELKPPITDLTPYRNRTPIQVKGKPLSEVIIEERR